jgi:hypothetical protein
MSLSDGDCIYHHTVFCFSEWACQILWLLSKYYPKFQQYVQWGDSCLPLRRSLWELLCETGIFLKIQCQPGRWVQITDVLYVYIVIPQIKSVCNTENCQILQYSQSVSCSVSVLLTCFFSVLIIYCILRWYICVYVLYIIIQQLSLTLMSVTCI